MEVTDPDPPVLDIRQSPGDGRPTASLDAVTTLIHSFASMITAMETRLAAQIRDNAEASKERWQRWEAEFGRYQEATDRRISSLEASVHDHHAEDERRRIATQARVQPVRSLVGWLWLNRRDIIVVLIGVATLLGVLVLQAEHVQ